MFKCKSGYKLKLTKVLKPIVIKTTLNSQAILDFTQKSEPDKLGVTSELVFSHSSKQSPNFGPSAAAPGDNIIFGLSAAI